MIVEMPAAPSWRTTDGKLFRDRAEAEKHEVYTQLLEVLQGRMTAYGFRTDTCRTVAQDMARTLQGGFLVGLRPTR